MYLGLGTRIGSSRTSATIQITMPAYLDPAKMRVGDVIGAAFTSGTYPDFQGNPVVEASVAYTVDGGPVLSTYVLQAGDVVGAALVHLTAGAATRDYYAEPSTIIDFSYATSDLEWTVPPGGGAVPDAFVVGNWSIADAGTNGDATVTISTLPADNGSALTDLEYRIGVGAAQSWGAAATGTYGIGGLPDGTATDIQVRAINASGPGAWSDTKSVTTTGAPDAFTSGQWTVTDLATGGDARIAISALPAANGSALTDLERKVGAGAWTSLAGTTTGNYDVAGFTDGVATNVLIRAVNAKGNGPDSDTKSVTTSAASSAITIVGWKAVGANSGGSAVVSLTALVDGSASAAATGDEVILVAAGSSGIDYAPNGPDGTWTEIITNRYVNETFKANLRAWRKRMGATPDTSVTVALTNNSAGGGGVIAFVARGVDAATALDVAVVTASNTDSAMVNPPAITPVTAGAMILAGGFGSSDPTPVAFTGPANMTGFHQAQGAGSTRGGVIGAAVKTDWTSGAFDPDPFTDGETSTSCAWIGFAIALRPA